VKKAFSAYPWAHGKLAVLDRVFPSYLSAFQPGVALSLCAGDTHFGYVHEGNAELVVDGRTRLLYQGDAFSVAGPAAVFGGRGIVVSRESWVGFPYITGPIEREGRLLYIDGCTDSLLIPPVKMGDPCLNLLYFPRGIDQTAHTHPSDRIGLILSGHGLCHAWDENGVEEQIELVKGMVFCIHTDGKHKFSTPFGQEMRVLAYHPESDFGPTDQGHPMINRTIVEGVPASQIASIQTKGE
jgi:quercetin dioxygenase-like cupin family protein